MSNYDFVTLRWTDRIYTSYFFSKKQFKSMDWKFSSLLSQITFHELNCIKYLIAKILSYLIAGAQLGIFWKVAQSLQKFQPAWLADEENFGLWNG